MTYYPGLYDGAMIRGLKTYNGPKSYTYDAPSPFTNSVFCKCSGQMPQPDTSGLNFLMGLTAVLGIAFSVLPAVPVIVNSVKDFFGGSNNGKPNGPDPGVADANNSKSDLSKAVETAGTSGDWQPVKTQYDTSLATYKQNETAIATCQNAIDKANEAKKTINDAITKLETENDGLDKQITDVENAIKASNENITNWQSQVNSLDSVRASARLLGDQAKFNSVDQQIKELESKIAEEKKKLHDCEKQKAQLGDKKKQNLTAITEKQTKIKDQDAIITEQQTKQNGLKDANNALQKELKTASDALGLRDINVEAAVPATNNKPAGSDKNTNVAPASNEQPAASTGTNVNPALNEKVSEETKKQELIAKIKSINPDFTPSSEDVSTLDRQLLSLQVKKSDLIKQIKAINSDPVFEKVIETESIPNLERALKTLKGAQPFVSFNRLTKK